MNSSDLTGAQRRKSTRSNGQSNCVEVAFLDDGRVAMRDSKDKNSGSALIFTLMSGLRSPVEWKMARSSGHSFDRLLTRISV
jgi:hypothetical protein